MHVHVYIVYKFKLYLLVCHHLMAVEMTTGVGGCRLPAMVGCCQTEETRHRQQ